jgi:hypothetical protein
MPDDRSPQPAAGTLTFAGHQRPALPSGDYRVTVTQTVSLDPTPSTTSRTFTVAGERFTLPPGSIRSVFPPEGALGDHSSALPHIVLSRTSLPWERRPGVPGDAGPQAGGPWLVLLLFCGDERPEQQTTTLGALGGGPAYCPAPLLEGHESAADPVNVIDVPRALLADLMPGPADLPFLAHLRRSPDAGDAAVVVGGRLPTPGVSCTAHLVSVEGRYTASGFDLGPDRPGALVRLVTLASWRFACLSAEHTFPYLARDLARQGSPYRLPDTGEPAADVHLRDGYVPIRHTLRQGGRTISWYRGPFTTGPVPAAPRQAVRTADALLRYHPATGMLDASYAAAWQLGRLTALRHTAAATALYAWKRRRAQHVAARVPDDHPLAVADIDTTPPPGALALLSDLALLRGVPFGYLVPDERLLPVETIRFFQVDDAWVAALVDGAYSVGRLTAADAERDRAEPPPVVVPGMSGALIRSALISGYPDLRVDAYPTAAGTTPLSAARVERLAPDILLCLFEGVFARLDLHQAPAAQHLGVELPAPGQVGKPGIAPLALGPRATVPIGALADALNCPDSATFAASMIETAERVTYLRTS